MTDNLEETVPVILKRLRLRGIFLSCESGKHRVVDDPEQNYTIWTLVFTEKQSDFIRYHLSYFCEETLTLDEVIVELDQIFRNGGVGGVVWTSRTTTSAGCHYTSNY